MTVDDVRALCQAMAAAGAQPTGRGLVRYSHQRGLKLSKKTALAALQTLAEAGETFTPAAPVPLEPVAYEVRQDPSHQDQVRLVTEPLEPVVEDPVAVAEAAVRQAAAQADIARENMDAAVLALWLSRGLIIEGVRYGGYAESDEARTLVQESARLAMGHYRTCWRDVEQARTQLGQVIRVYRRQAAEAWVQRNRRELVANMHHWGEKLRTATSDYAHAEDKKNHSLLRFAYEHAIAEAPVNGVTL
jgi:hypothetical protein